MIGSQESVADVVFWANRKFKSVSINGEPIRDAWDIEIRYDNTGYYGANYELRVYLPNGEYKFIIDRLNYKILTETEEEEMTKEAVKITVHRNEPIPPPIESVIIELTPEKASMLRYYFGRLSVSKVRVSITDGINRELHPSVDPEEIHRLTSSIYSILLEEGL